uniref:ATP synthase F0 subunit 8 n=1 Tax=Spirobrachia sp. YL-2014 TaxID=1535021 RepID=A0A0E3DRD3_9ANNE|nr:ATP synthase F0 subunit 8 [Spirobrachia sp. YL-2014]
MPHLAPLNWIMLSSLFLFTLFLISSIIWWYKLPSFPLMNFLSSSKKKSWKW